MLLLLRSNVLRLRNLLICVFLLITAFSWGFPAVSAKAYLVMNAKTGRVLYASNPDVPLYPASLTKVATALYLLDCKRNMLDQYAKVAQDCIGVVSLKEKIKAGYSLPAYWVERGGTHISLHAGERFEIEDLLRATLIASANDAANVLAKHVSGSVPNFMNELNVYLRSIGCKNTNFLNPHGIHHPDHKTSVRDLAIMSCRAMQFPLFREIVKSTSYKRKKTSLQKGGVYPQSNRLLRTGKYYYPYATGIKTGYHSLGKYCLIASAEKGDRSIILVLIGSKSSDQRYKEAKELFEYVFNEQKERRVVLSQGVLDVAHMIGRQKQPLYAELKEDVVVWEYPSEKEGLKGVVQWSVDTLPVQKGEHIGNVLVRTTTTDEVVATAPIYATSTIKKDLWTKILDSMPF